MARRNIQFGFRINEIYYGSIKKNKKENNTILGIFDNNGQKCCVDFHASTGPSSFIIHDYDDVTLQTSFEDYMMNSGLKSVLDSYLFETNTLTCKKIVRLDYFTDLVERTEEQQQMEYRDIANIVAKKCSELLHIPEDRKERFEYSLGGLIYLELLERKKSSRIINLFWGKQGREVKISRALQYAGIDPNKVVENFKIEIGLEKVVQIHEPISFDGNIVREDIFLIEPSKKYCFKPNA